MRRGGFVWIVWERRQAREPLLVKNTISVFQGV